MRTRAIIVFTLASAIALSAPALAHHSFAMFDREKKVSLVGAVKEFEFQNPHSWLRLVVAGEQSEAIEWSFEMGPPGVLRRQGWTPDSVHAGDRVTVQFHPMKDGSAAGQLVSVSLPDGKTLAGGPTGNRGEEEGRGGRH